MIADAISKLKEQISIVKDVGKEMLYIGKCMEYLLVPDSFYKYLRVASIETCSLCNLKCRYCNLCGSGRKKFIDINIYEKLLDELSSDPYFRIETLEIPLGGEFFLHPEAEEIIRLTKRYVGQSVTFRPWVILNDNMMLMNSERVELILSTGVFNHIICSIDGKDKRSFEHMRQGAIYETVMTNTEYLIKRNHETGHRILIEVNNGCDETCRDVILDNRMHELFNNADSVRYWFPVDINASFCSKNPHYDPVRGLCSFVFESISLSSGGKAIKCCMDLKEETAFGDLSENSLREIMVSEERKRFMKKMMFGRRKDLKGCSECLIKYVDVNNKRKLK